MSTIPFLPLEFLCYRAIVSFVFTQDDWPPSLVHFCHQCQALKIPIQRVIKHAPQLPDKIRRGLTPKKQHEVMTLATFINAECNKYGITQVLDMGAGLVSTVVTLQICFKFLWGIHDSLLNGLSGFYCVPCVTSVIITELHGEVYLVKHLNFF